MSGVTFHDRKHIQRLLMQDGELQRMFSELIRSVSPEIRKMILTGNANVWLRNAAIEGRINKELEAFANKLTQYINNSQQEAWARSALKSDDLVKEYIKGMPLEATVKKGMFDRNAKALIEFQKRAEKGMGLSDRIWEITQQTKVQLEHYIGSGISQGRSATGISQDIRQLLSEPDRTFRRIRNEEGKLIMSQPMREYHPGQGIYRSSFKNAMRLAVTETNMAYRTADYVRWNQLDFVTGVKVQRSGNGKPCRICDPLVGDYPKGFKFVGWHPNCICFATPIMLKQDDFISYLLDEPYDKSSVVTKIPNEAKQFINANMDSLSGAYFVKDNSHLINK